MWVHNISSTNCAYLVHVLCISCVLPVHLLWRTKGARCTRSTHKVHKKYTRHKGTAAGHTRVGAANQPKPGTNLPKPNTKPPTSGTNLPKSVTNLLKSGTEIMGPGTKNITGRDEENPHPTPMLSRVGGLYNKTRGGGQSLRRLGVIPKIYPQSPERSQGPSGLPIAPDSHGEQKIAPDAILP